LPHELQFFTSTSRLAQLDPQFVCPVPHWHMPLASHAAPVGHDPQRIMCPQPSGTLAHCLAPQDPVGEHPQTSALPPPPQVWGIVHTAHELPHALELLATHCPLQKWGALAGHPHWPLWQVIPPVHAVAQLPQYEALLVVSTQVNPQSVGVGAEQPVTHV